MAQALFADPRFHDDEAARQHLEAVLWPNGPVCPHCGACEHISELKGKKFYRPGLYFCGACRTQFTVTVGTVFERSKVALHKWVLATHLICSSKKGISSHQLHRTLGVTYKTAWFMAHRIREAMTTCADGALGGNGRPVEADETYVGGKPRKGTGPHKRGRGTKKAPVMVLVERDGRARSKHLEHVNGENLKTEIRASVHPSATIITDESACYNGIGTEFAGGHHTVNHSAGEYARGDIHSNTAESYFALLKRGHYGIFHHYSKAHLHRYCTECDFRWNNRKMNDTERTAAALKGIEGKRLTYRRIDKAA